LLSQLCRVETTQHALVLRESRKGKGQDRRYYDKLIALSVTWFPNVRKRLRHIGKKKKGENN